VTFGELDGETSNGGIGISLTLEFRLKEGRWKEAGEWRTRKGRKLLKSFDLFRSMGVKTSKTTAWGRSWRSEEKGIKSCGNDGARDRWKGGHRYEGFVGGGAGHSLFKKKQTEDW